MVFTNNDIVPPIYDSDFIKSIRFLDFENYWNLSKEEKDILDKKAKEILYGEDSGI